MLTLKIVSKANKWNRARYFQQVVCHSRIFWGGFDLNHVKWNFRQHEMARPRVADGGDGLQMWRVAAD
jgi:hypothetical protein